MGQSCLPSGRKMDLTGCLFPSLLPRVADPLWFNVDKPCDDEEELSKLEEEHLDWMTAIATKDSDVVPIGKSTTETMDDEDDDEDEGDVDDESESNDDDELDTEMIEERDSPDEVDFDGNDVNSDASPWGL